MSTLRTFVSIGIGLLIALAAESALALPLLDEFWIIKDSTEIFRDSFTDNIPSPSGPDGAATYSVFGPGGITSKSAGKLTMTPSLGDPTVITTTYADLSTNNIRLLGTNPNNPNFLGFDNSFELEKLFRNYINFYPNSQIPLLRNNCP